MGISNEELLKNIRYYQESLDKYTLHKNNYKLLSVIAKLKRLPISTAHLEHTGIGRTVNALRKLGGDVGDAAKGLVARWKEMVTEEEEKAKKDTHEESVSTTYSTENDTENYEESCEELCEDIKDKGNESSSSHISSDTEKKSSNKYSKESDNYSNSSRKRTSKENKSTHRDRDNYGKKRKQEYHSDSDGHNSKKRDVSSSESDEDVYEERTKSKSHRRHRSESSEDDKKRKQKKSKYSNDGSDSEDSSIERKSKSSNSSKNRGSSSSSKSKSSEKTESKKYDNDEKSMSKYKTDIKTKRDLDCEENKTSSKHKSKKESKYEPEETKKNKHESKSRHEKEPKESKSHSSRSDKKDNKTESKDKHRRHEEKQKKPKDERDKNSHSKASKPEERASSSKHRSGSERKKEKNKPVDTEKIVNGIDSGSGASFADALGMCGPMISGKSPVAKKKKPPSASPEKPRASSNYAKPDTDDEEVVPNLLKQEPPEPLSLNISTLLPEITPHYKPLGIPLDLQPRRVLTPDEALSQAISNKNMRTKVYSGNKSFGKVETLFDLCVRILQDNIDALEYTGGVPFLILKPVLERATPDQLFNMEHHNPYLIEDTDELWHLHCQKEFRTKKREELESWREMYMRCLDEREARLNAITANIKQSQDKSTPVRTTKLAYIDSVVKPPRNVARQQAKNGIIMDKRPSQTPSSRLSALATAGEAGKVAVPNPGSRAVDRSSGGGSSNAAALKPKKAPLMAKTLSLFKNRFRR